MRSGSLRKLGRPPASSKNPPDSICFCFAPDPRSAQNFLVMDQKPERPLRTIWIGVVLIVLILSLSFVADPAEPQPCRCRSSVRSLISR
jgi:hypothetical protein